MKDKKYNFIKKYLISIYKDDRQNTILESYGQVTDNLDYMELNDKERDEYFKNVVLNDEYFLGYVIDDYLDENLENPTEDEIAYELYKMGICGYDDYLAVCDIEECEPMPRKKWKVNYIKYDNNEWIHFDVEEIIEADSLEEIRKIIKDKNNFEYECFLERAEEIED